MKVVNDWKPHSKPNWLNGDCVMCVSVIWHEGTVMGSGKASLLMFGFVGSHCGELEPYTNVSCNLHVTAYYLGSGFYAFLK
jgi:hypothetical protein